MKIRSLALILLATTTALNAAPPPMLLPEGARAEWAVAQGKALPITARFDLDAQGGVWFLPTPRVLIRADGLALVLEQSVRDLAFGSDGLRAASDISAGSLKLKKLKAGWTAKIKAQLIFSGNAWRLAKGDADGVVAYGWDETRAKSLVVRLKDRREVLEWPARVLAAEGTAEAWYLATPDGIVRVARDGSSTAWGTLPGGISSLAWVEGAGLAVAGPEGVALFSGPGKRQALLQTTSPRVRARGNKLYVLLPELGGVLKITGLGR